MGSGLPRLSLPIEASSLVALAQISMRSRSCFERSLTRLFEITINTTISTSSTTMSATFQMRRESYMFLRFIAG